MFDNDTNKKEYSLSQFNQTIKQIIDNKLSDYYWVKAETADVNINAASGHCYLELIEKNPISGQTIAKIRGIIWSHTFDKIRAYFEEITKQSFSSGLKILVQVQVSFHEIYGLSLNILDIEPSYTIGDMVRKRLEIIKQLKEDGIFTSNKELPFPLLPLRIALITSKTAAGYGDFKKHLFDNEYQFGFKLELFAATMQGDQTELSVISALDKIYEKINTFDVVVITRGGGATSDLNSFDSYNLAAYCAQFPIPIITGIGHDRDETILDLVANKRFKTPTAIAEFLINCLVFQLQEIESLQYEIVQQSTSMLQNHKKLLINLGVKLPRMILSQITQHQNYLKNITHHLPVLITQKLFDKKQEIIYLKQTVTKETEKIITEEKQYITVAEQFIKMSSPSYILKKGYSLTTKGGKIIKTKTDLKEGDQITTYLSDGNIESIITSKS